MNKKRALVMSVFSCLTLFVAWASAHDFTDVNSPIGADRSQGNDVEFSVIKVSQYSKWPDAPQNIVISSDEDWRQFVQKLGDDIHHSDVIDFSRSIVAGVFSGPQPNPGYKVRIERLVETEDRIEVQYRMYRPCGSNGYITVVSNPRELITFTSTNKTVKFTELENRCSN